MDAYFSVNFLWVLLIPICFHCINGYFFSPKSLSIPIMQPGKDEVVAVNDFILLSCNASNTRKLSLLLNGTNVIEANASYISYNLTANKPEIYNFKCYIFTNTVKITFRYMPKLKSVNALVTGNENILHVKLNFILEHFQPTDYLLIERYVPENKTFQHCKSTICEFDSKLFINHFFRISFPDKQTNWTFQANFTYYKLDKLHVNVTEKESESLSLSYKIENIYDAIIAKNCLYRIFYKSEWEENPKSFTTKETNVVLKNLVPYTNYIIDVQAKLNKSIYWSDKSTYKTRTLSSAPYSGPHSTNGSYLERTCEEKSKRCFILYWATIPMALRNGILDAYVIQQDGKILLETTKIYAEINDQPENKDLWLEIRAKNNNSQFSPPTVIHIPPKAPKRPRGISVIELNTTHFNITWTLEQSQRNVTVTVLSCLGRKANSTLLCQSNVMWTSIKDRNFLILKAVDKSYFAAHVTTSIGSSSLTLAECTLSQGIARKPKELIISEQSPHSVKLSLPGFHCEDLNGRPTLFQILYADENNCENGLQKNISVIGIKPENQSVVINGMKPFTNYSFCLRICTEQGQCLKSDQIQETTDETNPSSIRNLNVAKRTAQSVTLKWDPTLQPNGIITYHRIEYEKLGGKTETTLSNASNMATISKLLASSKYNFSVSTCNKAGCSKKLLYITASTLNEIREDIIIISIVVIIIVLGVFICVIVKLRRYHKKANIMVEYPEMKKHEDTCHVYETIDSNSQSWLIDDSCVDSRMTNKEQQTLILDDNSTKNSIESVEMADLNQDFSTNKCNLKKFNNSKVHFGSNDINTCTEVKLAESDFSNDHGNKCSASLSKLTADNLDSDGYIKDNSNNSNKAESDFNHSRHNHMVSSQLNKDHLKTEVDLHHKIDTANLNQVNFDSNGYLQDFTNSSDLSQANTDSNEHVQDIVKPNLSQVNTDSNGYLQNFTNSSDLSEANTDSNGHVKNIGKPSEMSQVNSGFNDYVHNIMNSSDLSQDNSDSDYVSNITNSSESSQANSDSNCYPKNIMDSSDLSQDNSDSNYVSNITNSSESSQANSDSNCYPKNIMDSSDLSQDNSDSDYVSNITNSSESSQANSDSNCYPKNIMNSSDLSQVNTDSNGYLQNFTNFSDLSLVNTDSNRHVKNIVKCSELSQATSDSGYVPNIINTSESSQANSNSNGYLKNIINSSDLIQENTNSNGHVQDIVKSSELSQDKFDSNGYVHNIKNLSELNHHFTLYSYPKNKEVSEC